LWLGVRWAQDDLHIVPWAEKLSKPAVVVAVAFLVLRYVQFATDFDFGRFAPLFDKWNFGGARIFDFSAVLLLVVRFRSVLKPFAVRPLVMLGQASLSVFCVHLLCVFCALTAMGGNNAIYGWQAIVTVVGSLTAIFITAAIATKKRVQTQRAHIVQLRPAR
jgi:fucose 4-O-acetylase-like acetyltransferase